MADPFAAWPPEHYEDEIEREERRWAESPPWPLPTEREERRMTWEARETADKTGLAFVTFMAELMADTHISDTDPRLAEADRLLAQLRADEYEAGYEAGYAQHPRNKD